MNSHLDFNIKELFSSYMKLVDVPRLSFEETTEPAFYGKKLGLVNGSAWIQLWSYYFGRMYLPGVKLVNIGNEAVQLNFMKAHSEGKACPPQKNIELFARYTRDLVELAEVDAILITCSTMNRSLPYVRNAVSEFGIPVIQIDEPMMEKAVNNGGRILVIATHGPTVKSTQQLLEETAARMGKANALQYEGATVEEAFHLLGEGKIDEHNKLIANAIRNQQKIKPIDQVVLAQLSMSVFKLSYPEPEKIFGIPVLTSGEEGFKYIAKIFKEKYLHQKNR
ncbi:MAG TPA: hypothetical protein GXX14_04695 [Clostridiaceae bacterium]|nr:hypothetical protein [Clostridiaceae bacterium]